MKLREDEYTTSKWRTLNVLLRRQKVWITIRSTSIVCLLVSIEVTSEEVRRTVGRSQILQQSHQCVRGHLKERSAFEISPFALACAAASE